MSPEILNKTKSLCPVCLRQINANVIIRDNKVLISKTCPKHGKFECFHAWDDPFLYREIMRISKKRQTLIKDATLDITSKCNMNCPFCFSTTKNKSYEPEIKTLVEKAKLWKQGRILLYGGEPTLRKDIFKIIQSIKKTGIKVNLITNGLNLDKDFVKRLENSGLDKIELQFDSLNDNINLKIRGKKTLKYKIRAIKNIKETNIELTILTVLVKEFNLNEIKKILLFVAENCDKIKLIIFNPLCPEGANNVFEVKHIYNDEIFNLIDKKLHIKKKDFVVCTEFDVLLKKFLYKTFGVERVTSAPCGIFCHVFVINNKIIPISRLIELEKLSKIFDEIITSKTKNKLRILFSLFIKFIKKRVKISPIAIKILVENYILFMCKRFMKISIKNSKSFGFVINHYQDRYNIDYNFIKDCNSYGDYEDSFITVCEKNILATGPKPFRKLNSNMIINQKRN